MDTEWSKRLRQIGDSLPSGAPSVPQFTTRPTPLNPFAASDPGVPSAPAYDPFSPSAPPATTGSPFGAAGTTLPMPGASQPAIWPMSTPPDAVHDYAPLGVSIPTAVRTAHLALMTAAGLAVFIAGMGIYGLTELRDSTDKILHLDPTGTALFYATDYVDDVQITLTIAAAVLGVLFALGYVFVGLALKKGSSWPRPVGTALAVLSLPAMMFGPFAMATVVAGIVAAVASWMPSARAHAAQAKAARGKPSFS